MISQLHDSLMMRNNFEWLDHNRFGFSLSNFCPISLPFISDYFYVIKFPLGVKTYRIAIGSSPPIDMTKFSSTLIPHLQ